MCEASFIHVVLLDFCLFLQVFKMFSDLVKINTSKTKYKESDQKRCSFYAKQNMSKFTVALNRFSFLHIMFLKQLHHTQRYAKPSKSK